MYKRHRIAELSDEIKTLKEELKSVKKELDQQKTLNATVMADHIQGKEQEFLNVALKEEHMKSMIELQRLQDEVVQLRKVITKLALKDTNSKTKQSSSASPTRRDLKRGSMPATLSFTQSPSTSTERGGRRRVSIWNKQKRKPNRSGRRGSIFDIFRKPNARSARASWSASPRTKPLVTQDPLAAEAPSAAMQRCKEINEQIKKKINEQEDAKQEVKTIESLFCEMGYGDLTATQRLEEPATAALQNLLQTKVESQNQLKEDLEQLLKLLVEQSQKMNDPSESSQGNFNDKSTDNGDSSAAERHDSPVKESETVLSEGSEPLVISITEAD